MKYFKDCPICGKQCKFSSQDALNLGIKRNSYCRRCAIRLKYPNKKLGSAKRLNENSYESYYWLGFLCADGNFAEGRLKISISSKDADHLTKLSVFLGNTPIKHTVSRYKPEGFGFVGLALMDKDAINPIIEKYGIVSNKTENPVLFSNIIGLRNKLSFIAGFIDGDGCITFQSGRKDCSLKIKVHKSWFDVMNEFSMIITGKQKATINKSGYANFGTSDSTILNKLKRIFLGLNIPILSRKWDRIDLNHKIRYIKSRKLKAKIIDLFYVKNISNKEIAEMLKVNASYVSKIVNNL